ncbi:Clan CA, family C19, ubiquitin hydrolase-like cysteine peptidase [Trichomonas vaginalis G3]|uniref:Ubiquitin carboxyl-terminal hydrolase n=1 Tax=Trichomonas vaginalis (strain ATCC PRA-98 / G3) TaxID=412133 RepID=A2DDP8_TRIV3|nr:ubiquitinyl hydrolase protein [Trichomonas vaginalis G3]EAY21424.1 Clan CA, family C19, ubiquitin hydrolase-like cysteine peptidase [Trichomonas vaginalis G3]KAI5490636.1 ubiquitinyl hydrolase protein [Trichomonas vaginalis G3]|eukprot:XP_001582410.1 Clan CA, family C19, ubiquitin hydrolase-like cysteine peptidase [Trichomonas vaginalis G3]
MEEDIQLAGGITNLANTCYISSTLQVLLRHKVFINLLQKYSEKYNDKDILKIMLNLYHSFGNPKTKLDPTPIVNHYNIDKTKQQDVTEFMSTLLNDLIESIPKDAENEIRDIMTCKIEYTTHSNFDSVLFYTIPVLSGISVEDAFKITLDDSQSFARLPKFFFILIQRMQYDMATKVMHKQSDPMEIPLELDLSGWKNPKYQLFAVIQHIGSGQGGHYRVCLKDSEGWVMASDTHISPISEKKVLETSKSPESPAYLLAFVTDMKDITTIRDLAVEETPSYFVTENVEKTPKRQLCAFTIPDDIEKSNEIVHPIKIITQFFDQKTMEFGLPDEITFDSIDDANTHLELISTDPTLTVLYGYKTKYLEPTLPKDFGYYNSPLYVIFQKNDYRSFDRFPNKNIVKVTYEFGSLQFTLDFFESQKISDAIHYGKRIVKEKFGIATKLESYFRIHKFLLPRSDSHTLKSLTMFEQSDLRVCFSDRKISGNSKQTVKIQIYNDTNPTKKKAEISVESTAFPDFDDICASARDELQSSKVGLFAIPKQHNHIYRLVNPINPYLFLNPENEILILDGSKSTVSLIVFGKTHFIMNIPNNLQDLISDIESLTNSDSISLSYKSDSITVNNFDNPKKVVCTHPNGYFIVTSVIE